MTEDYLAHHGILGQKWGVRRYQNPDGTLTDLGKKRYAQQIQGANRFAKSINNRDISPQAQFKIIDRIRANKAEIVRLKRAENEAYDMEDKFWKNKELVDKYAKKMADNMIRNGESAGDRDGLIDLIKYDDVGQNLYEEYYLRDNKKEAKQYDAALKRSIDARRKMDGIKKQIVDDIVGAYGDTMVTNIPQYATWKNGKMVNRKNYTVSGVLNEYLDDAIYDNTLGDIEKWR